MPWPARPSSRERLAPAATRPRADLYREGFDPVLGEADEPDRSFVGKLYSEAIQREMARVDSNDTIVMVFLVWWWPVPAMLKGWIDRVWNRDWAYGAKKLSHRHGLMIGVASSMEASFAERSYLRAMREIYIHANEACPQG